MFELEPKRETLDQQPFVIRGHHLGVFANIIREANGTKSAAEYATIDRQTLEAERNLYAQDANDPDTKEELEYAQDVLGLSSEDADRFEDHTRQTYETFLALPDNHPAEIVEGIPDIICEGCTIGQHCRRKFYTLEQYPNALSTNLEDIDAFFTTLNILNSRRGDGKELPQPTISYEKAYFSDAEPQQVKRVKTTIGTVRRVLRGRERPFSMESLPT